MTDKQIIDRAFGEWLNTGGYHDWSGVFEAGYRAALAAAPALEVPCGWVISSLSARGMFEDYGESYGCFLMWPPDQGETLVSGHGPTWQAALAAAIAAADGEISV